MKVYSAGDKVISASGSAAGIPFYKHAIEIDPNFAMAYASLGRAYGDIAESALSAENTSKAYELRNHASEQERLFISASYDTQVTGNLEKAEQTCKMWAAAYPRALASHSFLGGLIYYPLGKYDQAAEQARATIALDQNFFVGYAILAYSEIAIGRIDEAEKALQQADEHKMEAPDFSVLRFDIAFLKDDKEGMQREVGRAQGKPGWEDWIAEEQALVFAHSGRLADASKMSRQATDFALKIDNRETAASYEAQEALWLGLFEIGHTTTQKANAALTLSKSLRVQYATAFALALAGDYARSQTLTDDLSRRFPENTIATVTYIPTLRALLAVRHNEPAKAIELLQSAGPYEMGVGIFYPAYVRGVGYLATREGREATTEFQKILGHPSVVTSDPIGALAHLQIGRAYAMQGDSAKAKVAYQDFLTLWKDADPDIPILKQAKAEYAKLQ